MDQFEGCTTSPALFNNLRKSAVIDAHDWLPPHVCDSWIGHSETVFKDHYAQVTEEHFKAAQNRSSRVAQSVAQKASEIGEKSGTAKKEDFEQDTQSPFDAAGYGKRSKAPENDGIDHWAMRDSKKVHKHRRNRHFPRPVGHKVGQFVPTRF